MKTSSPAQMPADQVNPVDDMINRLLLNAIPDAPQKLEGQALRKYVMQLPLWRDEVRGVPNEILRSALFLPANKNLPRLYLKDREVAIIGDGSIRFTGEELRQDDEPVWLQLLHLCRGKPLGAPVEFPPVPFLKAVGRCKDRNPSSKDYKWLSDSITRFTATALVIQSRRLKTKVGLSMVRRFHFQDELGGRLAKWQVWIEPEMATLFGGIYYTQLEWQMRLLLPSGITSWLMGFLSSHRKPYPVKVETIMQTISKHDATTNPRAMIDFRKSLVRALNELVQVGFLSSYAIENGLLITTRSKI